MAISFNKPVVSVLGGGWLGLPMALQLQRAGFGVRVSSRSDEGAERLRAAGLEGHVVQWEANGMEAPAVFWDADVLVVNVPPPKVDPEVTHVRQGEQLVRALASTRVKQVLFVGSTSVYAAANNIVTEEDLSDAVTASGRALRMMESLLFSQAGFTTTVLRPGGLVGYDRLPICAEKIARRKVNWDLPVNLTHRDDLVGIVQAVIEQGVWGYVFNVCMDAHPLRRAFYTAAAAHFGFELPQQPEQLGDLFKIVDSGLLKTKVAYAFRYNDPLALFSSC